MSENPITRQSYQKKRFEFLSTMINLAGKKGIEVGACDLPTVVSYAGNCDFADFRSSQEMIDLWKLPPETVVPVKYVVTRKLPINQQINERYDYVIACHVIEHIPNPIGYLLELKKMLNPGGVILIACPDKRSTMDAERPSTSIEHLLNDYFEDARYPSIEHILEFSKYWVPAIA